MRTVRRRARYWFDRTMSRGIGALIIWLAVTGLALVVAVTVVATVIDPRELNGRPRGTLSPLWENIVLTFGLRPAQGMSGHVPYLIAQFVLSLVCLFVGGALISLLTAGFGRRMEELRRGRSVVLERGHTIVLGWSDQIFTVVSELFEAEARHRRPCIAILADRDKVDMEHELRVKVHSTRSTRVVCRTGSPLRLADISLLNPREARSIIVLSPAGDDPDARVVKTLLAVVNEAECHGRQPQHVIASVRDQRNAAAAQLAGGLSAQIVRADDIAARLVAQTARQSGLSVVYGELLDFEGEELCIATEPRLAGRMFGEALHAYRTSSIIGLLRENGDVLLNPPMDTRMAACDQVIAISRDERSLVVEEHGTAVEEDAIMTGRPEPRRPERIAVLGWNRCAPLILGQLNSYLSAGSVVHVVFSDPEIKRDLEKIIPECQAIGVEFTLGDTTDSWLLQSLNLVGYSHVIVLRDDQLDPQHADSRTLITLLHLREIGSRLGVGIPVVCEIADDRNRDLVPLSEADDFIVSQKLISQLMTQLSENRHLAEVFAELFSAEGAEIYLRPADRYVQMGRPMDFYAVVEAARRMSEVAIGYRLHEQVALAPGFGVVINPDKAAEITFSAADRVIVLADV